MSGKCRKCHRYESQLTKHHVLPKRHFKNSKIFLLLCRTCHSDLERLIPYRKVHVRFYFFVLVVFGIEKGVIYGLCDEKKVRRLCGNLPDHADFHDHRAYLREIKYKGKPRPRKRNHRRKHPSRFAWAS